jgi:hypothetical protein
MSDKETEMLQVRLARIEEKIDGLVENAKNTRKILDGNGDPEKGLSNRVVKLESNNRIILWVLSLVATGIIGYIVVALMDSASIQKANELQRSPAKFSTLDNNTNKDK